MNQAAYKEMAKILNEEYLKYQNQKLDIELNNNLSLTNKFENSNRIIFNDNQLEDVQQYITQAALDLTDSSLNNHTDYTVSQIKNYQFWRSSNEILVVDSEANNLVTYAKLEDFFPKIIPTNEIKLQSTNFLLNIARESNTNLKLEYNYQIIKDTKQYIKSLNLYSQKIQEHQKSINKLTNKFKNVSSYLKDFSSKLSKDSLTKIQQKISFKAKKIKTQIVAQRLVSQASNIFDVAFQKTEEYKYNIGQYSVRKTNNNTLEIYDENKDLLLVSVLGKEKVVLNNHLGNLNDLTKALDTFKQKNIRVVGDKKIAKQYESAVFNLVRNLSEYKNGNHTFELDNNCIKLSKKFDVISLYNAKGISILTANPTGYEVNLALKHISTLNNKILQDLQVIEQENSVSYAANVVKKYLDFKSINDLEKVNFKLSYDPKSKIITYLDKLNPNDSFQAENNSNGWKRISGRITFEKKELFVRLNNQINSYQEININTQTRSQKIKL